jgi:hypothetical protein
VGGGATGLDAAAGGEVEGDPAEELFHVGDGVERHALAQDGDAGELLSAGELFAALLLFVGVMPEAVVGAAPPRGGPPASTARGDPGVGAARLTVGAGALAPEVVPFGFAAGIMRWDTYHESSLFFF